MREFNKLFIIALPRCATVSLCEALGNMGVRTAHLGRVYGQDTQEHHNPKNLARMHAQISAGDYQFDILSECDGLADYPACCFSVMEQLGLTFPGSLFINVRRDRDVSRWLQSVERQFVGLQLLKAGRAAGDEERTFMKVMLSFREMTFGQAAFEAAAYRGAYERYQERVAEHFRGRSADLLDIADISQLETDGFSLISEFLNCPCPEGHFPRSNEHSELPSRIFMQALEEGKVESQTGIQPD